jgi:hypothetical protein
MTEEIDTGQTIKAKTTTATLNTKEQQKNSDRETGKVVGIFWELYMRTEVYIIM